MLVQIVTAFQVQLLHTWGELDLVTIGPVLGDFREGIGFELL